ncbi:hypothetical protein AJ80_05714 [Polytolypa hystricis UAMH7299]|uniref:Uncharacterized protein n=1 Tax=Polytolypa hystricis (strain UAMH7299) TaxID=1447883 RepID=A0A2B7Y1N5_POLH7|nr:hypothetical protein AJ80_05714 [Polytolypa hystricis UAMH7299]
MTTIVSYLGSPDFVHVLNENNLLERNATDGGGKTALHWAISRADGRARGMARELLAMKFDINAADVEGRTPLHFAAKAGNLEIVNLLEKRANTEIGKETATPLIEVCCCDHAAVVQALLARRADVNVESKFGTPLAAAILGSSKECVAIILANKRLKKYRGRDRERLLGAGFDSNHLADGRNITPLQAAVAGAHKLAHAGDRAEVVKLLLDRGADANAPGGQFGTALHAAISNDNNDLQVLLRNRGAAEPETVDRKVSFMSADLDIKQLRHLPKVLESHLRYYVVAIMMDNEKVIQNHTTMQVNAYREAIQAKNIRTIKLLSHLSLKAFEEMVRIARCDMEGDEMADGNEQPTSTQHLPNTVFYNHVIPGVVRTTARLASLVNSMRENQGSIPQQPTRALHAASSASLKLELLTSAAVKILTDAIEIGAEEIVQMLARYWALGLRYIFAGKASDQMMEVLVLYRADEFECYFREREMDKPYVLAKIGLELMAAAFQGRKEDSRLAQLAVSLSKIWLLTLRNVVEKGYASYEQLEKFIRSLQKEITAGFEVHNWQAIRRVGPAAIEVLIGVVTDENAYTAHIIARLAINNEGADIIDNTLIRDLEEEFWKCIDGVAITDSTDKEILKGTRMWDFAGWTTSLGRSPISFPETLSVQKVRITVATVKKQLLQCIPMCSSPVYYLETVVALVSSVAAVALKKTDPRRIVIHQEAVSLLSESSDQLKILVKKMNEVPADANRRDDAARIMEIVKQLRRELNAGNILADANVQ